MHGAAQQGAFLRVYSICWLLLATNMGMRGTHAASVTGSLQEQQNTVCSFVSSTRPSPQHANQTVCKSAAKCLINELGWPTTGAEMFVAYLAAVQDYCTALSGDTTQCDDVPFCRNIMPDADGHPFVEVQIEQVASRVSEWYQVINGRPPKSECRPDWFSVLLQPCTGSAAAQMQHCMRDRPASDESCPPGCSFLSLDMPQGYCNAECWPPWVLKQLCNSTVQDFLDATRLGRCYGTYCYGPCVHEACAVAAHYIHEFDWTGFRGECKHTDVVDQLLANAPSMFEGEGCSVLNWLNSNTTDIGVLLSKVCQGTYPRPASIMPLLLDGGALGQVWLDAAARESMDTKRVTRNQLLSYASVSRLSFASTQQAALIQCPAGYRGMDHALSKPWLSPQLLKAVLPPDSAWRIRMLQGLQVCGGASKNGDVCVDVTSNSSRGDDELGPWLISNTSLYVVQAYCRQALSLAAPSSPAPPTNVTAGCGKISLETDRIRSQQAMRRKALAVIWYAYVIFLVVGFVALQLFWRLPKRRNGGARSSHGTCLANTAARLWHMLCPSVPDYHPSPPQAARAGPAPAAATGWRASLTSKFVNVGQALAYCVDVGLDIWTLVELKKNVDNFAALANAFGPFGEYSTQLWWRSRHSEMLFYWLIIVFVVQYAAGILLTLPSTLAAYGVFDYRRLQFSWGCCSLVFFTGACGIFVGLFFFVGLWYILVADAYMLLAIVGVPARLLQGNRLNLPAYTTLRYLCEGILEALPSALISTAALNQQLLSQQTNYMQLGVFWMSLIFSMLRIARELYKLACLTHELDACCFSTAVLDMIYHVQPQKGAGDAHAQGQMSGVAGNQQPGSSNGKPAPSPADTCGPVVTAPQPDTGMTRDSMGGSTERCLADAGTSAAAPGLHQGECSGFDAAAATDTPATGADGTGGLLPGISTSKQSRCCWRCQSCTEYPTVLAVYVYCCLVCLMGYLLLVCSDIAFPWLMSAYIGMDEVCEPGNKRTCRQVWVYRLAEFNQQYNLLTMITSVPSLRSTPAFVEQCALPSLTCDV